jgi:hypothetical protein
VRRLRLTFQGMVRVAPDVAAAEYQDIHPPWRRQRAGLALVRLVSMAGGEDPITGGRLQENVTSYLAAAAGRTTRGMARALRSAVAHAAARERAWSRWRRRTLRKTCLRLTAFLRDPDVFVRYPWFAGFNGRVNSVSPAVVASSWIDGRTVDIIRLDGPVRPCPATPRLPPLYLPVSRWVPPLRARTVSVSLPCLPVELVHRLAPFVTTSAILPAPYRCPYMPRPALPF